MRIVRRRRGKEVKEEVREFPLPENIRMSKAK